MFKSIILRAPWSTHPDEVERYCAEAEKFCATHVIVNILPDAFHPVLLEQPDNPYIRFATWGPSLDQFVSSRLIRDIYPEPLLSRNRKALENLVGIVRSHDLKPMLLMGEPRFLPERFFDKHPHVRGPRVDNTNASLVPLYAPCTDLPEVQEHYREMMAGMMELVPDLEGMIFYSGDSGTGFCHSEGLYPGANGPKFCRDIPASKRMSNFLKLLLETAQAKNPDFRIFVFHYIGGKERKEILETSPKNITSIAAGYFVAGGFEDCYAMYQYGMDIDDVGYSRAREERKEMMKDSIASLQDMGKSSVASCQGPVEEWLFPLRTVPYPFQALEIVDILDEMDSDEILLYGAFSDPAVVAYEANRHVIQRYLQRRGNGIETTVRSVAEEWGTSAHCDALMEAWRLCDRSYRERPLWRHSFGMQMPLVMGPLVPDPWRLTEEEKDYYWSAADAAGNKISGFDEFSKLQQKEDYRTWMLRRYETHAFPGLAEAQKILEDEAGNATGDARACLDSHRRQIGSFWWYLRCQYNWLEAGRWLAPGDGTPTIERSIGEIIDDEIQNSRRIMELADGHVEELFLNTGENFRTLYESNARWMGAMNQRIELMKKHRNDKIHCSGA